MKTDNISSVQQQKAEIFEIIETIFNLYMIKGIKICLKRLKIINTLKNFD